MSAGRAESSASSRDQSGPRGSIAAAQDEWISSASVEIRSDWIELNGGTRIHYLSAGSGDPLILLHGSGNSSSDWVPLMEQPIGRTYVAVDRPGYGLSDPVRYAPGRVRGAAVDFLTGLLDGLGLVSADLVGSSGGSVNALWMAMDAPDRVRALALLGATPLLPGTRVPFPLRLMASPIGSMLSRLMPDPSPETVVKMMGVMGESDSITRYPQLIDLYVKAGADEISAEASRRELTAMIRGLRGFRPELLFGDKELKRISQPTILIWGDRDPVGDTHAAERVAALLHDCELHLVPTGHAPWWGRPEQIAGLLEEFYRGREKAKPAQTG